MHLDEDFTVPTSTREAGEDRGPRGLAVDDAVVRFGDHREERPTGAKVLFVVTDGEDNASRESFEQAVRRLQEENGPTVYAIGLLGEEKARRARRALEIMSERTGGIAFLPKTLDEVDAISRAAAHDIRNQYTIGYKPTTPKTVGGYRTIKVDAKAHGFGNYCANQERVLRGTRARIVRGIRNP